MKTHALVLAIAFGAIGCRTAPEPTGTGVKGVEKIQILAKGME